MKYVCQARNLLHPEEKNLTSQIQSSHRYNPTIVAFIFLHMFVRMCVCMLRKCFNPPPHTHTRIVKAACRTMVNPSQHKRLFWLFQRSLKNEFILPINWALPAKLALYTTATIPSGSKTKLPLKKLLLPLLLLSAWPFPYSSSLDWLADSLFDIYSI